MKLKRLTTLLLIFLLFISATACQFLRKDETETSDPLLETFQCKIPLRFNDSGEFRILVISDLHLKETGIPEGMCASIKTLVDREEPDLVVLNGDNIYSESINNDEMMAEVLRGAMAYIESKQIPWMHIFGNHDSEFGYSRERQQAVYESMEYCISKAGEELTGVGNYATPIYASDSNKLKFVLWCLDSGSRISEEDNAALFPVESTFSGFNVSYFDYIHSDQIRWYTETSRLIEEQNGKRIPGIMFFHIPIQEFHTAWVNREALLHTGDKREPVNASSHNSGMFQAMYDRKDIKAVCCGHDHINDFMVEYAGMKLCYSSTITTNTYHDISIHGGRVFVLHEENPEQVDTYMSYINE